MTEPRFGDLYEVKVADRILRRIIVSSGFFHTVSPDTVITADVETKVRSTSVLAVSLGEHGTALVDRLHSMSRDRLMERTGQVTSRNQLAALSGALRAMLGPDA
jgi:mRNA-degrading endonuclease toxin of MazEF toxin-antitoxin module